MHDRIKMDIGDTGINVEIHHLHVNLESLKQYIKDNFCEFYFGRNAIVVYQDIMATQDIDQKRKKLVNWLIKTSNMSASRPGTANKILDNFKKQIKIKVRYNDILNDVTTVRIAQFDSRSFMIEVKNDTIHIVLNYIKTRFLFHLVKYEKEQGHLIVSVANEGVGTILQSLLEKKSIAGKKISFLYERNYVDRILKKNEEQKAKQEQNNSYYSPDDSIRTYMNKIREAYVLLRLDRDVKDLGAIKKQYYRLAKIYHPDNYYQSGDEVMREYEQRFMKIKEAYETIKDYLQRRTAA